MMEKIRIITDSGSDLPQNFDERVTVLPMCIRFGETEYRDGIDITTKEFYEKLIASEELPATSLISPGVYEEAFAEAMAAGEQVVVITIAGKLSGTYQSAMLAAKEFTEQVFVVDSQNVATAEQILVLRGLELMEQGKTALEIAKTLEQEREQIHIVALLDTLEYLKKGGRISSTVAFVGGVLSIKPIVTCKDGVVSMIGKARGIKSGIDFLINNIENTSGIDGSKPIGWGYTGLTDELLEKFKKDTGELWKEGSHKIAVSHIGSTIGTHIGPGAIAIAFFCK